MIVVRGEVFTRYRRGAFFLGHFCAEHLLMELFVYRGSQGFINNSKGDVELSLDLDSLASAEKKQMILVQACC